MIKGKGVFVILVAFAVVAVVSVSLLTFKSSAKIGKTEDSSILEFYSIPDKAPCGDIYIFVDKKTGVEYIYISERKASVVCPRYNADGSLVTYSE